MRSNFRTGIITSVTAALLALFTTFAMAGNSSETVLQVSNLSCHSCAKNIETELRKHKGMEGMSADIATGRITIKHSAELTPEKLAELVSAAGYPAKLATAETTAESNGATDKPSCKGCAPKDKTAKKCDTKNCNKKDCDHKNCDGKNCDHKNCAGKNCDKKGCKTAAPGKS